MICAKDGINPVFCSISLLEQNLNLNYNHEFNITFAFCGVAERYGHILDTLIKIRMEPQHINFFNRIMEGYEYLGVVTTLNKAEGLIMVRTTPDMRDEVLEVIDNLDFPLCLVEEK